MPFLKALEELGFAAGRNVAIEYRFAEGQDERLPVLAAELVRRQVTMLVATDRPSALGARAATATIPIVFTSGSDPIQLGLVASFNRPGGNATGVSMFTTELGPKRLGLVRELLSKPGTIAFVVNPSNTTTPFQIQEMMASAQAVGQPLLVVNAGTEEQVDKAFATMAERNVAAILYGTTLFFQVVSERTRRARGALSASGTLRMARIGLSPLILCAAGGRRLRLPEGRHRWRSLRGRVDLGFGELAPQVCQ